MTNRANIVAVGLLLTVALVAMGGIPASANAAPPTVTTEAASSLGCEEATFNGTVNPEGTATTYYFEYGKTKSYGAQIPVSPASVGSGTSNVPVSQTPTGLDPNNTYHFRVVGENEAGTDKGEDAVLTTTAHCHDFSFAEEGSGNGQLSQPFGIDTDSEGNIWVTDTGNNRVEKFSSTGEYLAQFGSEGTGNGQFKSPKGIAVDSSNNVWVVDSGNNRVQKFNSKGEYLGKFGEKGSGTGAFEGPTGIAFDQSDRPFVVDTGNNRIEKFNGAFSFLSEFGKKGTGNGELESPTDIEVDAAGRIWVVDTGNDRVQRFNASNFNYISQFGGEGSGNGEFNSPTGIVSDFQRRLWVVDSGNDRAQKFNVEGDYLDQFGESGEGAGQLTGSTDIAAPTPTKLLIVDSGNDRVEGWTVKAEPPTATTNAESDITASSATLNARINPEGLATSYFFEYGTTTAYGSLAPIAPESIGSGTANILVEQPVSGLSKSTTYHYRVVAENDAGRSFGKDLTLKLEPPKAITDAATAIGSTEATLNGTVDPEGSATTYWFEYGETETYGTKIPFTPASAGSGTASIAVSRTPTGLKKSTTYHFRVVAENAVGLTNGADKEFTTAP